MSKMYPGKPKRSFPAIEICILAGGLSKRMGRDKSRLHLGGTTMLGLVRKIANTSAFKVRVIRRDLVPRCGPLGGIYSGLKTTKAEAVIFLACDMPFVSREMIERLAAVTATHPGRAVFFSLRGKLSFPLLIPRAHERDIARQIRERRLSIQSLGKSLRGKAAPCPRHWLRRLENVNTPEDLKRAKAHLCCPGRENMLT